MEAEGVAPVTKPAEKKEDAQPSGGSPRQTQEKHSWIPMWDRWSEVDTAWADEETKPGSTPEEEVRQVLEKYRQAYEKKDLALLADVYETLTPAQREANEKYFQQTQNLSVTLRNIEVAVRGNEAVANYTREDHFIDLQTGQKVNLDARFTKIFVRQDGGWKMTVGRK
jgi:ketosteroid isomerase-like protein